MSQAASLPGATALGSFGAGGEAALAQYNLMQQQQAAQDKLTADAAAGTAESQQEISAWQQAIQRIGTQKGVELLCWQSMWRWLLPKKAMSML